MTWKNTYVLTVLVLALICLNFGQGQSTTSWPEEHGLIVTYLSYRGESQLHHFPEYPGYENVSGELNNARIIVSDVTSLKFTNPNTFMQSICVDYRKKSIYMYDEGQSTITMGTDYSKDLNLSRMEFVEMHAPVSKRYIKLAVDWLSHTVYWADPGFRWIAAAPGQRDKIKKGYYKIIVRSHVDVLHGIALDPLEAMLFWTDKGQFPKIECSDLAGRERRTLVSKYLKSPSGLVADIFGKRIYWIDEDTESLLSVTYSGDDPKTIARIPYSHLFEADVFRDILYVTDTYIGMVRVLNKTSGKELEKLIYTNYRRAYGIAVYGDENQPIKEKDHCESKKCDHFCITEKHSATCVCSEGYSLNEVTGKCKENNAGYHKAIVIANATNICLIDMRAFVGTNFSLKCIFSVNSLKSVPSPLSRKRRQMQPTPETNPTSYQSTTPAEVIAPVTTATATPTVPPGAFIEEFDMDMTNRIIFYATADNSIYKRPIDALIEDESTELMVKAAGNISGLAYDAEDINNLYWCESDTGNIWVINTVSRAAKNITPSDSGIRTARDIIVLLNKRMLAMVTGKYPDMSIQTMTMAERTFNALVSGKSDIAAFTYDSEKQIFYYASSRHVYSVSLNGGKSTVMFRLRKLDVRINSLVLYQNYLAWSYQNGTGLGFKTYDLLDQTTSDPVLFANTLQVDIKILDLILQTPKHISPCAKDNGGCSQICITRYNNGEMMQDCECRLGYTLENNVSCTTAVFNDNDNFVLVADSTNQGIFQINLDTQEVHAVSDKGFAWVNGVYYDEIREKVIVAESFESEIISLNLNGSNRQVLANLEAHRFDLDRTTGNLYFSDKYSPFVGIITRSGEYVKILDDFGFESLRDIAVHPGKGWMYYAVGTPSWIYIAVDNFASNYIGRANMDGSEARKLVRVSGNAGGLAIDYVNDHLFWSESTFDTIQQCNLDGLDCVTIVNLTGTEEREEITDLETDGVYLYYSSYRKGHVVRVELTKPYKREIIVQNYGFGKLSSMALYSSKTKNIQPLSEGCRNRNGLGDCSTICLPTSTGRTCVCESGVSLKPDGRTCFNIHQCTDAMRQTVVLASGEEGIIYISMNLTCSRYIDSKCNYRCPMYFEPTFDTLLTCTAVGWNLEPNILCKESPKSELSVPGVVVGFVILGILVIGLVVFSFVLFRRKMTFLSNACFDNKRGGSTSISIANPGFGLTS